MILSEILGKFTNKILPRKNYQEKIRSDRRPDLVDRDGGPKARAPGRTCAPGAGRRSARGGLVARRRSAAEHEASDVDSDVAVFGQNFDSPRKKEALSLPPF